MKFNINYYVRVKLTKRGRELYKEWYKSNHLSGFVYKEPIEDEDGYSQWQLWKLMLVFGQYIDLGEEEVFDTEIIIEEP